ncbi:MAG: GNAT family N-acetyltransferase [Lachnospiraceae bacterium]|nr:GNAT family N-acetyltransferase [Lachnospiraceae bacterium]
MEYTNDLTGEEYNHLREAVDWRPMTLGQAKRGLEHTTFLVVAREEGRAIAMGRALFDFGYTAYIGDVIVTPEYQGKGIGRHIVETLIQKVMEAAEPEDRLMFILGAAKGKEGFYEKLGFKKRPDDFSGHGMTMWRKKE